MYQTTESVRVRGEAERRWDRQNELRQAFLVGLAAGGLLGVFGMVAAWVL